MPRPPILPELKFAVVGAQGVGKSTFVRCALDLKRPPSSAVASKKMSLEGDVFSISLLEFQLQDVRVAENAIIWPHSIQEAGISRIDGVLALYDVTERETLSGIPNLLSTGPAGRPRAVTATQLPLANKAQPSQSSKYGHNRAISEMTLPSKTTAYGIEASNGSEWEKPGPDDYSPSSFRQPTGNPTDDIRNSEPSGFASKEGTGLFHQSKDMYTLDISSLSTQARHGDSMAVDTPATIANSFLELGDQNPNEDEALLRESGMTATDSAMTGGHEPQTTGITFEELVDRLLAQPMSRADSKFVAIFLCLYRKFAAPAELLSAICSRFETLGCNYEQQMTRMNSQLRYLALLAHWTEEYPGDFAHPVTRIQLATFVNHIAEIQLFAAAAGEMYTQLDTILEDEDTRWLCSDYTRGLAATLSSFGTVHSMQATTKAFLARGHPAEMATLDSDTTHANGHHEGHLKASPSVANAVRSQSLSSPTSPKVLTSAESSQGRAELLKPIPRNVLSKPHWHQFMEFGNDNIACELTRIDWIMYSSMRPRDLLRHVSLTSDQKDKCRSLEHVNRMINQFNHVAFWVANMILLRDKPKHRAKTLEKFMGVAWRLRHLNNYNSLGAVIAGINGTAVHRLAQTRELVSAQARRDFMRLEILMGTQRSHFAYRLAWDNTVTGKIPFLPLHRRDLVSAEEGNRTFIPGNPERINWRKFEVMGDTIVGIQRSQGTPYPPLSRNLDIQRLILEVKFSKDDDELYERSLQLEGPGLNEPRRRFNWFQR